MKLGKCKYCEYCHGLTEQKIGKPETKQTTWFCLHDNEISHLFLNKLKREVKRCKKFKLSTIKLEGALCG